MYKNRDNVTYIEFKRISANKFLTIRRERIIIKLHIITFIIYRRPAQRLESYQSVL